MIKKMTSFLLGVGFIQVAAAQAIQPEIRTLSEIDGCSAVRAAIDSLPPQGGTIRMRPGVYECKTPIVLNRDNVTLTGLGEVLVRLADNSNAPLIVMGNIETPPKNVNNITVSNLVIDGNMDNQQIECWGGPCDSGGTAFIRNNGITVRGVTNGKILNVLTKRARSGGVVTEKGCYNLLIDGLTSVENFFDGFAGYETYNAHLKNMELSHNRAAGISIDIRFHDNIIEDTKMRGNGDVGIFMRDSNSNTFKNVAIINSRNHGIFLAHVEDDSTCASDNVFHNLKISESRGFGFRLNNACAGNRLTGRAEFMKNRDGCISEGTAVRLNIDGQMVCED